MFSVKLTQIGNSVGAVFPKELLAHLHAEKGDTLFFVESPQGFTMTPYDPAIEEQLAEGREFMREYRDAFHALAK
ncbi:MAG: AbrB/MazE/SpoVT family DNA-binding domain-containing protein [Rhodocyclaceae bacterium]|nr:AbrB/MazE/SpoVT family DNA-binding domain-containing protein [Rhodocyclaceae bacterium]